MIALARKGDAADKNAMLTALQGIGYGQLSESQQIDLTRAFELVIARMGMPDATSKAAVIAYLNPHYPAKGGNELNRELIKSVVLFRCAATAGENYTDARQCER
jgi:hypothetical protein